MSRPLLVAVVAAALLVGCGEEKSTGTPLDDVEVTGEAGDKPTLEFDKPFEMTETDNRILEEGDGEEIALNAMVSLDFVLVNGRTGKELSSSFESDPLELRYEPKLMDGIEKGLEGVTVGSQVLVGIAPEDGLGADPTNDVEEDDSLLMYADIQGVRTPLNRAEGEAVVPKAGLPTVKLAEDGAPTITVPDGPPPDELIVQLLIKGEGPKVEAGDAVTVHYAGALWRTGEPFGSTWERGTPTDVDIGSPGIIPGWNEGLEGVTVGSQVLLVIPPDKGYPNGSPDGGIKPGETLVFVIDILDAK